MLYEVITIRQVTEIVPTTTNEATRVISHPIRCYETQIISGRPKDPKENPSSIPVISSNELPSELIVKDIVRMYAFFFQNPGYGLDHQGRSAKKRLPRQPGLQILVCGKVNEAGFPVPFLVSYNFV